MYTAVVEQPSDLGQHSFGRMMVSGLTVVTELEVRMLKESLYEVKG